LRINASCERDGQKKGQKAGCRRQKKRVKRILWRLKEKNEEGGETRREKGKAVYAGTALSPDQFRLPESWLGRVGATQNTASMEKKRRKLAQAEVRK